MSEYIPSDDRIAQLSQVDDWSRYRELADKIYAEGGKTSRYPTKWKLFNDYIGGGFGSEHRGELVVLLGDTGVGKSTFATNLAVHMTGEGKTKCHYISLENPPEDAYNTARDVLGIEHLGEYEKRFTSPHRELLFEGHSWRTEDLILHMQFVAKTRGTKLFIIDHLNFMLENEEQAANENNRTRVVMRLLSQFCMNHKATVFVISHINKLPASKSSEQPRLSLHRIFGSQAISGAATKVLAINEVPGTDPRHLDVQMLKSRYTKWDRNIAIEFDVSTYQWQFVAVVPI